MLHRILKSVLMLGMAFAFGASSIMAQTSTIQGTVTDSETSETLPGVNVFIPSLAVNTKLKMFPTETTR